MQFYENEIKEYVEFAWSTLDLKTAPAEHFPENSGNSITASIQISGEWRGIVALKIEHALAQQTLRARYPQYRSMQLSTLPVVATRIRHVASWGALDR